MVLVVYNGDSGGSRYVRLGSGHRLIIFYTLTDDGGWQVVKTFDIAIDLSVLYSVTDERQKHQGDARPFKETNVMSDELDTSGTFHSKLRHPSMLSIKYQPSSSLSLCLPSMSLLYT